MSAKPKAPLGARFKDEAREVNQASKEIWTYARNKNWKQTAKGAFQRKYLWWWVIGLLLLGITIAISIERDKIVSAFNPHKQDIINFPASWVFPVLALIIVSFPPLFGHEIILLVVGLIWGVGIGFGIACLGTLIGELACFFVFKYFASERAKKVEDESIFYACLAKLMREGGVFQVILVRLSAIPGHVVTAIQSTVGMSIWIYAIAVVASLPKQLAIVYLGQLFGEQNGPGTNSSALASQKAVSGAVLAITILMTAVAMYIVYMRARKLYPEVKLEYDKRHPGKEDDDARTVNGTDIELGRRPLNSKSFETVSAEEGYPPQDDSNRPRLPGSKSFETISESGVGVEGREVAGYGYAFNESRRQLLREPPEEREPSIPYQQSRNPFEDVGGYPQNPQRSMGRGDRY